MGLILAGGVVTVYVEMVVSTVRLILTAQSPDGEIDTASGPHTPSSCWASRTWTWSSRERVRSFQKTLVSTRLTEGVGRRTSRRTAPHTRPPVYNSKTSKQIRVTEARWSQRGGRSGR
eukprot:2092418-Prymnesium_polylepis.1